MSAKVRLKMTPQVVIKAGQDAAEVVGKKFGSFVYTTARQSIKRPNKKGDPSPPGTPPKNKSDTLKKNILFAYDKATRSVVIGPRLLPGRTRDAAQALEAGKSVQRVVFVGGKQFPRGTHCERTHQARHTQRNALPHGVQESPSLSPSELPSNRKPLRRKPLEEGT